MKVIDENLPEEEVDEDTLKNLEKRIEEPIKRKSKNH